MSPLLAWRWFENRQIYVVLTNPFVSSHLILTESMLSVYKQAEGITPADEAAFAFYALVTVTAVHYHHHTEEEEYCAHRHT